MKLVLVLAGLTITLVAGRGVGLSARILQREGNRKAAVGFVPDIGSDGGRSAQRPRGDRLKVVVGGRTLLILSGPDEAWLAERLHGSRIFASVAHDDEAPPQAPAGDFWLYRPAVLLSFVLLLLILATLWFFGGYVGPRSNGERLSVSCSSRQSTGGYSACRSTRTDSSVPNSIAPTRLTSRR